MKKQLGNRTAQWCFLIVLACGASWISQALLPYGYDNQPAPSTTNLKADSSPLSSMIVKPAALASRSTKGAPNFQQFQLDLSKADGSSLGLQPEARPTMANANEPSSSAGQPPAPPGLPAKPMEKPAPKPLSNRIVEYHMNVELDAQGKMLTGTSSLTWKNPGKLPVQEIYFHLYPNAFNSPKTTFMKESGGRLRDDKSTSNNRGGMDISSIKTLDGEELLSRIEYVQPDDGNKDDRTLMKIKLPKAVNSGESVTLDYVFSVKLPAVFARMGYADDFVMAGQWFPKVAVYEPAGSRGRTSEGWNLHQYHGNSEFYADFGIYDVRIKVPSSYIVAATGFPIKPPADDGKTKTYAFYSDDVHDFAWAASPNFIYYEEPYATPNLPGVKIKLYLDPKHEQLKTRYMTAAKKALARYSQWYGSYPYATLSIVVPPENGNGAGGMEYPTLITGWGAGDKEPDLELERVIVHEIGHQFWYGMVASNEFEEAWLDEGFTSYTEDKLMELEYGVKPNLTIESSYITDPEALKQNSWNYSGHGKYAENVYTRAKLVLESIESQIGSATMDRVMRAYFQKWKFKHPTTSDFQAVLESTTKRSWDEFFKQYVYGGFMVDYSVAGIKSKKVIRDGQMVYENTVQIQKLGGTYHNIPIRFHFADGSQIDKVWDGIDSDVQFKLNHPAQLDWVAIDPQHTIILENKRINSFLKTNVDSKLTARWNLGVVKLMETLFSWVAW
ncbi:M1 family metallopeptidase [Paenibacillus radicis (ex Xue et al. 2023)]|uniref:M1 family metallopeptidase n=1 Tax=Paenibacillus radicis (ex Xue et al. 2023) TaxID=2972489 RepID=A0ABT1YSM1_9BACL|nr:M1 family metallopeptidase [Paenibacillus radicis (ex Xue et al. 2023)]MCR8636171.1 M1 family metallopeptidase [Paenibacillus radicis (ex Xue et al. 2023)]